ncbi:MAG: aminotransferase class V-fold PLP-dependent enzyme, partial [Candidatus Niyogibacteria bacterium]|nr:aminotransferase class V-fold PLP-dependent enzyme [Candidatus Niyogibacteria bacterium]
DLMTVSAHKIYGPKGVGALYLRDGIKMEPVIYGGGQEYGLRSGTQNVPLIAGFAKAVEILAKWKAGNNNIEKIGELRDYLWTGIKKVSPACGLNGPQGARLPNNLNVHVPGIDGEILLIAFSEKGVCVSSGSACASRSQKTSHVITAIGGKEDGANLRITLGRPTTKAEIDLFLGGFKALLSRQV